MRAAAERGPAPTSRPAGHPGRAPAGGRSDPRRIAGL